MIPFTTESLVCSVFRKHNAILPCVVPFTVNISVSKKFQTGSVYSFVWNGIEYNQWPLMFSPFLVLSYAIYYMLLCSQTLVSVTCWDLYLIEKFIGLYSHAMELIAVYQINNMILSWIMSLALREGFCYWGWESPKSSKNICKCHTWGGRRRDIQVALFPFETRIKSWRSI